MIRSRDSRRRFSKQRARYRALEKKLKTGSFRIPWTAQKRLLTSIHHTQRAIQPERYVDADPYKLLSVDPSTIEYHVNWDSTPRVFGTVADGDWDRRRERLSDIPIYQSLVQRFREGEPWENTELYEALVEEPNGQLWNRVCDSERERSSRLAEIDALFQAIASEGYLSQRELLERNSSNTHSLNNEECHPVLNEIGINIGRDGELLWRHRGLHRLSIAKILDLDRIPVLVLARHRNWKRTRDRVRSGATERFDSIPSHPDLRDLT